MPDQQKSEKSEIIKLKKLLNLLIKHIDTTNLSTRELLEIIKSQDEPQLDSIVQNNSKKNVYINKEDSESLSLPFKDEPKINDLDILSDKTHIVINEQLKMQKTLKREVASLKASVYTFHDIFNNIHGGLFMHDLEGNFLLTNSFFWEILGYSKNKLETKNIRDFIPEQHKSGVDEYLKRIITNGYEKSLFKVVTKNGSEIIIQYSNSIVQGKNGPIAVRGMVHDVTEQIKTQKSLKESEKRLKESEQKYRDIFENINAYIYIHDFEGNYIETNSHFVKNTGYSKNELKSMNIKDYIPKSYGNEIDEYINRTITNGHDTGLLNLTTKNGRTRVVEYTSSLIGGKDGPKAIRGMARDITEEFRVRNALEKSEEELQIAHDNLEKQVRERTRELKISNEMLELKTVNLEEANITLRVLLSKKDEAKKEGEEKMLVNINDLVLPLLAKVKLGKLDPSQNSYLDLIELNLNKVISPFAVSIDSKYYKLSSMEIQIANLINEGKTTRQIASLLNITTGTINTYRNRIRKKLGIKNKKVNLRAHLTTLQE